MNFSEPLFNQIRVFLLSVGVGVPLCVFYVVEQSLFRVFGKSRKLVFAADILFCFFSAFVSFFFMVFYNSGRVRLHLISGEVLGFFVFYFTVGKYLLIFFTSVAEKLNRSVALIMFPFVRVGKAFVNGIKAFAHFIKEKRAAAAGDGDKNGNQDGNKTEKNFFKQKKFDFISKIHLKNKNKSV